MGGGQAFPDVPLEAIGPVQSPLLTVESPKFLQKEGIFLQSSHTRTDNNKY